MSLLASLNLHLLFVTFFLQKGVLGFVDMTCSPTNTALGASSTCTCTTDSGTGIAWQEDGSNIMLCFTGGTCDSTKAAYDNGYSTSGANEVFTITIKSFGFTDCSVFTCKDQDTTDTSSETLTVYDFTGSVTSTISEPGSGKDGNIETTTDCLYPDSDIIVKWYSVDGGVSKEITSKVDTFNTSATCSDASKVCSGKNAVTLNIGFPHSEKKNECGNIKVEVYHSADPSTKLELTTTGIYCIEDVNTTTSTPPTTTSTTPTTTSTKPTTTSTTPTTTSTMPTTSSTPTTAITTPTTSTMVKPTTTISSTATSITTVGNSSDGKLVVIIVSSVVGGLLVVGIAIASLFIFHRQRNKKHATRNRSHLGRDHHKQYKTSKSPYQQKNDYHLYNGRSHNIRSQVEENHLNRVSKERRLNRSYNTEASSRYDNYRPVYSMEHVYPLSTSGHRFMSEYIDENRNPKNHKHSSYPGYSMGNMRYTDNKIFYY